MINISKTEVTESQPNTGSLFCFVLTNKKFHRTRIPALTQTWLPNCDAFHIYSDSMENLQNLPAHELFKNLPESYWKLFWKSRLALQYSFANVSSNFDWYLKSDDDSYFFVDKLRNYLNQFDPNEPHLFGFRLKRKFVSSYFGSENNFIYPAERICERRWGLHSLQRSDQKIRFGSFQ